MDGGKPPRKGGEHHGKVYVPSYTDGTKAWAKDRSCQATRAIHAQADPQALQLGL